MSDYTETAFQNAESQGLTSAEVEAMDFDQVHELAGVDPHAEGLEPFFWETVRMDVAQRLLGQPQVIVEAENGQAS